MKRFFQKIPWLSSNFSLTGRKAFDFASFHFFTPLSLEQWVLIVIDNKLVEKGRQHSSDHEELFNDLPRFDKLLRGGIHGGGTESRTP